MGMKEQETSFRDLQLDEVKKLIDDGYDVVDVREDWEWNKGHVPGAKHVVLSSILANPTAQKFQDRTVFVCQAGERSAVARRWPWRWASRTWSTSAAAPRPGKMPA